MENEAKGLMRYMYNIIRQTLSPIFFSTSNCGCHKNIISLDDRSNESCKIITLAYTLVIDKLIEINHLV